MHQPSIPSIHKTLLTSALAGAIAAILVAVAPCPAQDFRIDTEVFVGAQKQPAAETLTIFSSGLVYDFLLNEPEEITILDTVRGRFTLLDPGRRVKCGIDTKELLELILSLDSHAIASKDPLFVFAAQPKFEPKVEEYEENGQKLVRLRLTGKPLEYVAVAHRAEQPDAVRAFRSFADWYARLNALRPGNLPPGARLELNQSLAERGLIPLEITRTIPPANPLSHKVEVRSRHLVNWTLSGEDRKKIDRAGTCLAEFQPVSFDKYRTPTAKPASATVAKQAKR